jgi:hypothetical protein
MVRDSNLNVSGTLSLPPTPAAEPATVPISGRNEPGKLILEYEDPRTGVENTITYQRERSPDGAYTIWRAEDDAPEDLSELRAPINVSSEPARTALELWSGASSAVIPVQLLAELMEAHREAASEQAVAAVEPAPIAVVAPRPNVAAWDGALSRIGSNVTSMQTFSTEYDGVLFTVDDADLVRAWEAETGLLKDLGGVLENVSYQVNATSIPVDANPNLYSFSAPVENLFHTYAVENYNLAKIAPELDQLVERLKRSNIVCRYGDARRAVFNMGCVHHCAAHRIQGNYLVQTLFTFSVGEERNKERQIFVYADSWAAAAGINAEMPGRDRFTYSRSSQKAVEYAHQIAVSNLSDELADMYDGFRRD